MPDTIGPDTAGSVAPAERLRRLRWEPTAVPDPQPPAEQFLRLACLAYDPELDVPQRRARARALLAAEPALASATVHVAAATGHVPQGLTAAQAEEVGGPYGWPPLMYLAYARHDLAIPRDAVLDSARALLDAGADPDAGRLWHGLPSPFTVLTGVLGEGELGPDRQPRHPHWRPLAELLLDRGANPNDGQGLYNRMFTADDEHLELLLAHGLGRGDGGPWRALLGDAVDSPAQLVAGQLDWAVTHDLPERARLLLGHGARPTAELAEKAARFGHRRVAGVLREAGAPEPRLGSVDAFLGAVLAGQEVAVSPGTIAQARAERPGILVWAAATGRSRAVATLLDLGFDVDARGRGDIPEESTWETALHHAAGNGDVALVRLLLARGADRRITDERFDATAAGWATHAGHLELATELLEA